MHANPVSHALGPRALLPALGLLALLALAGLSANPALADTAAHAPAATMPAAAAEAAADHGGHHAEVAIYWVLPFAALLAMIALMPLLAKHFWEHNYSYVAGAMAVIGLAYYLFVRRDLHPWTHEMKEYVSFIALLASLFVVSGGIVIHVSRQATPLTNVVLLLIGAVIANIFGTTGASMLLIRPYLRINKAHLKPYHIIFFIFVVSNCGGCLTPIGDPPLFLGYLKGIPFFWTLEHLWPAWALCVALLLAIFYAIEVRDYGKQARQHHHDGGPVVGIKGIHNFLFILLVLAAVFQDSVFDAFAALSAGGMGGSELLRLVFSREPLMLYAAVGSRLATGKSIYTANEFSYAPIREVAILFVAIFSTMVPALEYLEGNAGKMPLKTPGQFYFSTGALSSVLDNAPTYLTFLQTEMGRIRQEHGGEIQDAVKQAAAMKATGNYNVPPGLPETERQALEALEKYNHDRIASGKVGEAEVELAYLVGVPSLNAYIIAISLGAVFFGACTYIGNGPNFMVKAIAESSGVAMPSFLGYVVRYTLPVLIPVYVLIWLVFFVLLK